MRVRNPVSFTGREDVNVRLSLPVQRATGGLITLTFLNAPVLFVANLKPREVGLRLPNLPLSIVVTALVGITMQLVVLMLNLAAFALFERTIPNFQFVGGNIV